MGSVLQVMRWEWFKLQRRRMSWILLAILLGFSQIGIWGAYMAYSRSVASGGGVMLPFRNGNNPGNTLGNNMPRVIRCGDLNTNAAGILPEGAPPQAAEALRAQCRQMLQTQYRALMPSRSVTTALGITATLGMVLLAILSASAVGIEYGLGTLRPILAGGVGRLNYLAGKYLALAGATTAALLLVAATAAGSGALAFSAAVAMPDITAEGVNFADVAATFARTWTALVAFMTIAASITLITRSTAAGMAVSIGYLVFEGIFVRLMSVAFDWFETVGDYLPMRNLNALARSTFNIGPGGAPGGLAAGSDISLPHAGLMTALYAIAFATLAIMLFRRRDLTGGSGG